MKKLIKLSLLAIFLGIHPVSCDKYDGNTCEGLEGHAYYISNVEIDTKHIANLDIGYPTHLAPLIDTSESYHNDSIGFLMSFESVDLAFSIKAPPFLGFQNMAIACSPLYHYRNPVESIVAIYSGSSITFNDSININTGDTITNIFNVSSTFNDYSPPEALESYSDLYQNIEESLLIRFSENNKDSIDFRFDLITTLTDGKVFKSEHITVKLLPSK
ncbi:hypothetical protein Oweho_3118 [Owenweeksia hongkongensis DSM 17368]|uniref:Uncharacterized protein n=1 Tax=Owenweeksia hongkongensis (strain DSM 17368 / CIP 108786 / JCM 12287 / NRRL B-23963 / UST20020801) TaxID=926562 RepID=G8R347_OWEHD|nr:hypothetical protein [Owenweeksia hongkongensis]AEV34072.1 hypothetical protein Oweho_3118 [Owenweeksia hongkongensis DSM 17368]